MRRTIVPILACLMAGGIASAQTATTETDAPMGGRPEVRIFSGPGMNMGMGLGFPFNSTGAFLGVYPAEVTDEIASKYSMSDPHGALLTKVEENTAASRAGLQVDDIIVEWNGTRVESGVMLRRMINETPVGRKVRIGYLRNGVRADMETKLEQRQPMNVMENLPNGLKEFKNFKMEEMNPEMRQKLEKMLQDAPKLGRVQMRVGDGRMGAMLQNMNPQLATYFGVQDGSGALVGSVREGSAAQKGGMQVGDVIVAVDGQKVANPGDVARIISGKDKGEVELRVIREKSEQTLRVTLDDPAAGGEFTFPNMGNSDMKFFQNIPEGMKFTIPDGEMEIMIAPPSVNGEEEAAPNGARPDGTMPDLGSLLRGGNSGEVTMKRLPSRETPADASRANVLGLGI